MKYYLAYGSNLNLTQMQQLCPDATVICQTTLSNYTLNFKRLTDSAYLTLDCTPTSTAVVPVVIYQISPRDQEALDAFEDFPTLYNKEIFRINFEHNAQMKTIECFAYVMNPAATVALPTQTYWQVCLEGYRTWNFDQRILFEALARAVKKQ
ncbi:gamma-glutamylcyclotransferase family protein [Mycoplasmopsis columbinasalis]|uniref:Gamma-glutamylcyclotransferase AIG2-like domain-containing protein n=1 Tax=Mycoplasmopsis columbinasalis TaxID=114880 RepID=A0A449B9M5_9BACT|nr:gamma-glutamylcyclotransferase family protein [Mycoplasmopsis columbinasalis]VEU77865.1 Uncharacterised protein [Mycoplasmopsis columbinasalis]